MYFSKISLYANFQPNPSLEPFHWKAIDIEVTLNLDKDKIENAEQMAEEYIKDYISRNTVNHDHVHIEVGQVPLPIIQVDRGQGLADQTLEQQIRSCKEMKVLKVYESMVKKDSVLQKAYNDTMSTIKFKEL